MKLILSLFALFCIANLAASQITGSAAVSLSKVNTQTVQKAVVVGNNNKVLQAGAALSKVASIPVAINAAGRADGKGSSSDSSSRRVNLAVAVAAAKSNTQTAQKAVVIGNNNKVAQIGVTAAKTLSVPIAVSRASSEKGSSSGGIISGINQGSMMRRIRSMDCEECEELTLSSSGGIIGNINQGSMMRRARSMDCEECELELTLSSSGGLINSINQGSMMRRRRSMDCEECEELVLSSSGGIISSLKQASMMRRARSMDCEECEELTLSSSGLSSRLRGIIKMKKSKEPSSEYSSPDY